MSQLNQRIQSAEWHVLERKRILAQGDTGHQSYQIAIVEHYGRCMIINDCIQSTEADEADYHEALIFPAAISHGAVRKVICFGGANGGVLKRLALLPAVDEVIQVDVDETLYHLSRHYLPHMHPDRPLPFAVQLNFAEPVSWLRAQRTKLQGWADLIIADLPDATRDSHAPHLFTTQFYRMVDEVMAQGGAFVTQAGQAHPLSMEFHRRVLSTLRGVFSNVTNYSHFVPSYGVPWAYAIASQTIDLSPMSSELLRERVAQLQSSELLAYDVEAHQHMFHLPRAFRAGIYPAAPIEEGAPEFVEIAGSPNSGFAAEQ